MGIFKQNETVYGRNMSTKTGQYEALICKAETINRDSNYQPSKAEAVCYRDALKVCEEIRDMNISQRAEYAKWQSRVDECREKVTSILEALNPAAFHTQTSPAAETVQQNIGMTCINPPVPAADSAPNLRMATPRKNALSSDGEKSVPKIKESGFTTKNACKDVPADVIEKWYKPQPCHDLGDVTGMGEAKAMLLEKLDGMGWQALKESLDYEEQKFILFYGLPGTGKTFVIEGFISELMKRGYKFISLKGGDIHASLVGVGEKTVNIAFQEAIDNEPCVVFIDEFDNVCVNRNSPNAAPHEKKLTVAFLEAYNNVVRSGRQVVMLGATNYPNMVDSAMWDRMVSVIVPLPDEESRMNYFKSRFKTVVLSDDLTFEYMAETTVGYSYRDLGKITSFLKQKLLNRAIEENAVYDESGEMDRAATDKAAGNAVHILPLNMYEDVLDGFVPSDKSSDLACIEDFEKRFTKETG